MDLLARISPRDRASCSVPRTAPRAWKKEPVSDQNKSSQVDEDVDARRADDDESDLDENDLEEEEGDEDEEAEEDSDDDEDDEDEAGDEPEDRTDEDAEAGEGWPTESDLFRQSEIAADHL